MEMKNHTTIDNTGVIAPLLWTKGMDYVSVFYNNIPLPTDGEVDEKGWPTGIDYELRKREQYRWLDLLDAVYRCLKDQDQFVPADEFLPIFGVQSSSQADRQRMRDLIREIEHKLGYPFETELSYGDDAIKFANQMIVLEFDRRLKHLVIPTMVLQEGKHSEPFIMQLEFVDGSKFNFVAYHLEAAMRNIAPYYQQMLESQEANTPQA